MFAWPLAPVAKRVDYKAAALDLAAVDVAALDVAAVAESSVDMDGELFHRHRCRRTQRSCHHRSSSANRLKFILDQ